MTEALLQIRDAFARERKDDPKGLVRRYAVATGLGTNVSKTGLLEGDVALAAVVRANTALFEDGRTEKPGVIVHSRDRLVWEVPEVLTHCVDRLFGPASSNPWSRLNVVCATRDDRRPINMDLAPTLTNGFDVQLSSVLFQRRLLPQQKLGAWRFPVIVPVPGESLFVPFVVHESSWPQAWRDRCGA